MTQICRAGYASAHRDVSFATKLRVYAAYGITQRAPYGHPGSYEMDHLIPLELGGSNSRLNLFPEPYPGYIAKDHMENIMRRKVCDGEINLRRAQLFFVRQYIR
jgi:hypothetical protein